MNDIVRCPKCKNYHISNISCNKYLEIWSYLISIRNLLVRKHFNRDRYPAGFHKPLPYDLKRIEILMGMISGIPVCCCKSYANGKSGKSMDKRLNGCYHYVMCDSCESEALKKYK